MTAATLPTRQQALPLSWPSDPDVPLPASTKRCGTTRSLENWIGRLSGIVAEVAAGDRPAAQLFRCVEPGALERLRLRTTYSRSGNSPINKVLSVRVVRVSDTVYEGCSIVQGSRHCQAVAVRVRRSGNRWMATAVEIR
ncbi:MAG: Rv3235 family protein [Candidatus Nanopelagicales bacterium]|nr:Rv3235 family protein [Candidatus Nanopelagicales bacterium]MDZ4249946.1 Rv3235 family protein [Candidatus Nanopelagicales bacterium]